MTFLIFRRVLTLAILSGAYFEVGIYTFTALLLLTVTIEALATVNSQLVSANKRLATDSAYSKGQIIGLIIHLKKKTQ